MNAEEELQALNAKLEILIQTLQGVVKRQAQEIEELREQMGLQAKPEHLPDPNRAPVLFGYARVSTAKQVISIENQQEKLKAYYAYAAVKTPGIRDGGVYSDTAKSGSIPFHLREAGMALYDRLQPGDHIAMTSFDRGFRNLRDVCNKLEIWERDGITLHLLDWGLDTSTSFGRFMLKLLACVCEFERVRIAERTRDGFAAKRKRTGIFKVNGVSWGKKWVGNYGKRRQIWDPKQLKQGWMIVQLVERLAANPAHIVDRDYVPAWVWLNKNKVQRIGVLNKKCKPGVWNDPQTVKKTYKYAKNHFAEYGFSKMLASEPAKHRELLAQQLLPHTSPQLQTEAQQ